MTEATVSEVNDSSKEIIQSEERKNLKKEERKKIRTSRNCGAKSKT